MIPHSARRGTDPVRLVVVHTTEGARSVAGLRAWFTRPGSRESSHAGVDDEQLELYVPYGRAAWTLRRGNSISDNLEVCGFARWTSAEWLTHRRMLELTAEWIRERCRARRIPVRKLTPAQVAAGQPGVCGHVDWTVGMRDGNHTDPGPGFPWAHVITLAQGGTLVAPRTLRKGDRGPDVHALQERLRARFPDLVTWSPSTELFGDLTDRAVRAAQHRLGLTVDGVVGPATRTKLGL